MSKGLSFIYLSNLYIHALVVQSIDIVSVHSLGKPPRDTVYPVDRLQLCIHVHSRSCCIVHVTLKSIKAGVLFCHILFFQLRNRTREEGR